MKTAWAFVVILYVSQAFHAGSVSSATVPANLPTKAERAVSAPPRRAERAATPQLPARTSSPTDEKAAIATRPKTLPPVNSLPFHNHGTLATQVPVGKDDRPVFGWHVTVYSTVETPYEQICGGSLVKKDTAISAAHCFWDEDGLMPAEQFALAVGQRRRQWQDARRYQSNVSEIIVPPRFRGIQTNFQDDIAVLRLATAVDYRFGVRPVCVDFDLKLERWHFDNHGRGLITGFGLTEENGEPSEVLNYQRLPYVEISACINASDPGFLKYLTSDKICAGDVKTGRALCRGDSGGGLLYFTGKIETAVMFLRGVASAAPRNNNKCNAFAIAGFTHVRTHRTFLRDHIPGLEEECKTVYPNAEGLNPMNTYLKPIESSEGSKTEEDSKVNPDDEKDRAVNTEIQPVGGPQAEAHETMLLAPSVGQSKPYLNQPYDTPSGNVLTGTDGTSNEDRHQKPNVIIGNPLQGPVKPSVLNVNGANQDPVGFLNEAKVGGSPNTNIIFFTGPVVLPSELDSRTNATPVFVGGRPDQPTNIYVFVQN